MTLKILAWNIRQGGGPRVAAIASAIKETGAHVAIISEYRPTARDNLIEHLKREGFEPFGVQDPRSGHTNLLIATRITVTAPEQPITKPHGTDDAHRFSHVVVQGWNVLGCYVPGADRATNSARKRNFWHHLLTTVDPAMRDNKSIIIGDLNTGLPYRDELGRTFVCSDDMAELEHRGWRDAWTERHPTRRPPASWWSPGYGNPFRLDHALLSPGAPAARSVKYLEHLAGIGRNVGGACLSDHAALLIELPTDKQGYSLGTYEVPINATDEELEAWVEATAEAMAAEYRKGKAAGIKQLDAQPL